MILFCGGTPAMQRTLRLRSLVPGAVNRAYEVRVTASGKVSNAARIATTLGGDALALTFLGGDPGRFVSDALAKNGVRCEPVWVEEAPTRTCVTLVPDEGPVTELVEEAPRVPKRAARELEESVAARLPDASALCLIGTMPPGVPEDIYARLVCEARERGVPTLLDAQKDLLTLALRERPFLAKPNLDEAASALGLSRTDDPLRDAGEAARALLSAGAVWALVTVGERGAVLAGPEGGPWRIQPPRIEAVNPIGSGDALAAGLLLSMTRGATLPEAAAYGTACAAANALTLTAGVVHPDDVKRLLPQVRIEELRR